MNARANEPANGPANDLRRTTARMIATTCGIGRLPWMPGSWGSAAALPFCALIELTLGPTLGSIALLACAAALFVVGFWASRVYLESADSSDPPEIVIDEVAGQTLALAFLGGGLIEYALGFALFRIADITKIWPVGLVERRLPGAAGVMFDDIVAGLYAGICALLLLKIIVPALLA